MQGKKILTENGTEDGSAPDPLPLHLLSGMRERDCLALFSKYELSYSFNLPRTLWADIL